MYASGNIGRDSSHDHTALAKKYFMKCVAREKENFKYIWLCIFISNNLICKYTLFFCIYIILMNEDVI